MPINNDLFSAGSVLDEERLSQVVSEINENETDLSFLSSKFWTQDITSEANSNLKPSNLGDGDGVYDFYTVCRMGPVMLIRFRYRCTKAGTGSSDIFFNIPFGLTHTSYFTSENVGTFQTSSFEHLNPSSSSFQTTSAKVLSNGKIHVARLGSSSYFVGSHHPASGFLFADIILPINEWQ